MIKINLLPPELRPLEKTPLARFIAIIAGSAVSTAALCILLILQFRSLPSARLKMNTTKDEVESKKEHAARYDALQAEIEFFKLRIDTVKKISKERYVWSKKLYELHQVIDSSPKISLNEVSIEEKRGGRNEGNRIEITIDGYSIKPDLESVSEFMLALRNSPFFEDCESIDPGDIVIKLDSRTKEEICEFTLTVKMKPKQAEAPARPAARRRPQS